MPLVLARYLNWKNWKKRHAPGMAHAADNLPQIQWHV